MADALAPRWQIVMFGVLARIVDTAIFAVTAPLTALREIVSPTCTCSYFQRVEIRLMMTWWVGYHKGREGLIRLGYSVRDAELFAKVASYVPGLRDFKPTTHVD